MRPRGFDPADAFAVHSLLALGYARGGGEVAAFEDWWSALRGDEEFAADLCFLAVDRSGDILGVAQCWTSAFIKDLVVHPKARRRGLGEALLTTAFQAFQRRGAAHVDLKVRRDNRSALRLYRRLGMREVPIDG